MFRGAIWLSIPLLLLADDLPVGVHSGYISDIKSSSFKLKTTTGLQFECTYDHRTWFEQSRVRVPPSAFQPTDLVEIVADRRLIEGRPCYIRTVRLADLGPKESGRMRITYRPVTENLFPRGEFAWAGTVSEVTPTKLVVRTNNDGYKTVTFRRDTRFFESGVTSVRERLSPNTRVSLRAGRSFDGELEVYQVIWGSVTP